MFHSNPYYTELQNYITLICYDIIKKLLFFNCLRKMNKKIKKKEKHLKIHIFIPIINNYFNILHQYNLDSLILL